MNLLLPYVFPFIIGVFICVMVGLLQYRRPDGNLIHILAVCFLVGGIYCLITADEILYVYMTIVFIFSSATAAAVKLLLFIKKYVKNQRRRDSG
ncbi:hypothetical protein [Caenibacillus caldisaponilyticus]|uniref:hypothetical protein n=1 Tax=Caenibacillus caldisaponilyticus TaxID=1674942 RepID=UPI0009889329|nr:hypothetical protein [Caenibacillus caldisaponilyticus]